MPFRKSEYLCSPTQLFFTMKPVVLAVLVLAVSAAATPRSDHPHPENDQSYLRGAMSSEATNLRNGIPRLSSVLLDLVPNAADILAFTKEQIETKSADVVIKVFNDLCNSGIVHGVLKPHFVPPKENIEMHLWTNEGDVSATLGHPQRILEAPILRHEKELAIFITGLKEIGEHSPQNRLKEAYKCRGHNFLEIDVGRHIRHLHNFFTIDTEQVGEWIGEFLKELTQKVRLNKIHLIGHGVGAHCAGAAGRKFTEITGDLLPRITGLDPSILCYKQPDEIVGMQPGDAEFVDAIHTSNYGKPERMGDVDFYPNGPTPIQPFLRNAIASHKIAVDYFAETVIPGNEENFRASHCNSMKNLIRSWFCLRKKIPMGINTPKTASGNFFLQTKMTYPYGANASPSAKNNSCWKN